MLTPEIVFLVLYIGAVAVSGPTLLAIAVMLRRPES